MTWRRLMLLCALVGVFSLVSFLGKPVKEFSFVGYTDHLSYEPGDVMKVSLSANTPGHADIPLYDISGNLITSVQTEVTEQTSPRQKPWREGFGFQTTFTYRIPDLPTGNYSWGKNILFTIRSKTPKPIAFIYDSNTLAAYNWQGGRSFYSDPAADVLSFERASIGWHRYSEACMRWLPNSPFKNKVNFLVDQDMDNPNALRGAKLAIIPGHSEYWSRKARENLDLFVRNGNDVLILSGNTMWWQIRYTKDKKGLVCYRGEDDPIEDERLKTVNWFDPRLGFPIEETTGLSFARGGYGHQAEWNGLKVLQPNSPLFKNINVKRGQILRIKTHEFDGAPLKGFNKQGEPLLKDLGFYRHELIAYTPIDRQKNKTGSWVAFQKTPATGITINTGTTDWCSKNGLEGPDGQTLKQITTNMITALLNNGPVFSKGPKVAGGRNEPKRS